MRALMSAGLAAAITFPLLAQDASDARRALVVRVDPRVELMSLIFRLAGSPEYLQAKVPAYAAAADQHFERHRDHAGVKLARELRREHGVSFDAVMSMAIHVKDAESLAPLVPLDPRPETLDERWQPDDAERFLREAKRFVRQARFTEFLKAHEATYEQATERMQAVLDAHAQLDWFDRFFGARPAATFELALGMLNGGACYGPRVRLRDGTEALYCVLGVWQTDADGAASFDRSVLDTVVHEFCHSYCNVLADANAEGLEPAATRIWPHVAARMKLQAYGSWQTMMRESLVRACVVRYRAAVDGAGGRDEQVRHEEGRGFVWTGPLAALLEEYESARAEYPTLETFMPRVVGFFEEYVEEFEARQAKTPTVVSIAPENGAQDVDPALRAIVVTFDRPMLDGAWAVVRAGPNFPKTIGKPSYDADCKVLTIPVELEADHEYELWLNRGKFDSFQSQERVKLEPVRVTFRTRARD